MKVHGDHRTTTGVAWARPELHCAAGLQRSRRASHPSHL